MSLVRDVESRLVHAPEVDTDLSEALREAERLADVFKDVKPQPYVVPIGRFAGLPVYRSKDGLQG